MGFWELFFRVLVRRPVAALAALYWQTTRRKVRARNRLRIAAANLPMAYDLWIAAAEKDSPGRARVRETSVNWNSRPTFIVALMLENGAARSDLSRSIVSIDAQTYPVGELVLISEDPRGPGAAVLPDGAILFGSLADAFAATTAEYLVPLRTGDQLSDAALFRFAEALQSCPSANFVYGDEDGLADGGKRVNPWFKPEWNRELFLALDYLSSACAVRVHAARKIMRADSDTATDIDALLLAVTAIEGAPPVHVPHVLCHVRPRASQRDPRRHAIVARHLQASGATCTPGPFNTVHVQWPLPPELPLVTIVVPTRDKVELLRSCVDGVLEKTSYAAIELLVVDNGSKEPRTAAYLAELGHRAGVRVLGYDKPYNFAAINNFAARAAKGRYLCLLNNDTEVLDGEWLTEMMRYAVRPEIGAVGAKLLYDDGTIQHAGVVIGIGQAAGHAHRNAPANEPGYFLLPHVTHYVSAVTAACLVVDKGKYEEVGGLDEEGLAVAFNDVDFCLKLQQRGYRNVYVPHAVLLHHESKSRGSDAAPENIGRYLRELEVLQTRWGTLDYADPVHNPNLDRSSETFIVRI